MSKGSDNEIGLRTEELEEFLSFIDISETENWFYYKDYIYNTLSFIQKNICK